jgi:hypothetical protein
MRGRGQAGPKRKYFRTERGRSVKKRPRLIQTLTTPTVAFSGAAEVQSKSHHDDSD